MASKAIERATFAEHGEPAVTREEAETALHRIAASPSSSTREKIAALHEIRELGRFAKNEDKSFATITVEVERYVPRGYAPEHWDDVEWEVLDFYDDESVAEMSEFPNTI